MSSPRTYLEIILNRPPLNSYHYLTREDDDIPKMGRRVMVKFGHQTLVGFVISESKTKPKSIPEKIVVKEINRFIDKKPVFTNEMVKLAYWMSDFYFCSPGQTLSTMVPSGRRDVKKGEFQKISGDKPLLELTEQQDLALKEIIKGIDSNNGKSFLLHGITGSGKTEVYRHAVKYALDKGKKAIILVPEIALTPQTIAAFKSPFPEQTAILHSGLTPAQRITEWRKIITGKASIAIGARSAIFAPLNPDLIIIDEEHENSYKAGDCPRYHARQIAFYRTKSQGTLILGSATPTLETLYHAQSQRIKLLRLDKRISPHAKQKINTINMINEVEGAVISKRLLEALQKEKEQGNQSLLFINRRGYSPFIFCKDCEAPITCPNCNISLSYHRHNNRLLCHYCGHEIIFQKECPTCHGKNITIGGTGTERIEDFLAKRLPQLRIERMDSDSISSKNKLFSLLKRFSSGDIDVLIGTQMITKGFDFPNITLVGIISADLELNFPDFRSYERIFNQLTQVIGRAGRDKKAGMAIIQTLYPHEDPIQSVIKGDHTGFLDREMSRRKDTFYPPFSRMVRIVIRSSNEKIANNEIEKLAKKILSLNDENATILGPAPCPLSKISKNYRFHLILKAKNNLILNKLLHRCKLQEKTKGKIYLEIDIDPISML